MKLRNLLFGTMIACAFASCSDGDDPINNIDGETPVGKNEAVLVVNMAGVQSKANIATTNENAINSATTQVVVFNGTGDAAAVEVVGKVNQSGSKDNKIALTPGNKMVLVLANYKDEVAVGTTYAALKAETIDFASYEGDGGYLTMNSQLYTVSLAAGKVNYLGYAVSGTVSTTENYLSNTGGNPVYLYHNVAKVVLNNVTVGVKDGVAANQYPNPKLDVKKVFILHAHKNSKLFTEAAWGETNVSGSYLNAVGTDADSYVDWVTAMSKKNEIFKYLANPGTEAGYEAEVYADLSLGWESGISNGEIASGTALTTKWGDSHKKTFYTYENPTVTEGDGELYTLLVVKGDFSYDGYENDVPVRVTDSNRYYSVAVGITGFKDGYTIPSNEIGLTAGLRGENGIGKGVIRNLQYNVGMTVKGPGYTTPFGPTGDDDTFLAVNVKVVAFGEVNQDASFE